MIEKISLANSHLPQLIGFVLMSIGYTLGNKFYLTHKCNIKVLKNVKSKEKVRIHTNFF